MALSQNNENYIERIMDSVFEKIQDEIAFSGERFISEYNNIGSEGLSDLEIEENNSIFVVAVQSALRIKALKVQTTA